jgi:hypothetical protein
MSAEKSRSVIVSALQAAQRLPLLRRALRSVRFGEVPR